MRRRFLAVVLMALVLGGVGATAAHADDDTVPPLVFPTEAGDVPTPYPSIDPSVDFPDPMTNQFGDPVTPGPVADPTAPPPSQQQIEDARNALNRLNGTGQPTVQPTAAEVAGPRRLGGDGLLTSQQWWTLAAGLLVLLVASDAFRLNPRPRGGRRKARVR
jgi:hypothetical protein